MGQIDRKLTEVVKIYTQQLLKHRAQKLEIKQLETSLQKAKKMQILVSKGLFAILEFDLV